MVWARTTARRGWLCQADLGGKRRWTTEQRKTEKDGSTSSSTIWRTCSSTWRMPRIELNGEGEPVWLTPHLRDPQPEVERECWYFPVTKASSHSCCLAARFCRGCGVDTVVGWSLKIDSDAISLFTSLCQSTCCVAGYLSDIKITLLLDNHTSSTFTSLYVFF